MKAEDIITARLAEKQKVIGNYNDCYHLATLLFEENYGYAWPAKDIVDFNWIHPLNFINKLKLKGIKYKELLMSFGYENKILGEPEQNDLAGLNNAVFYFDKGFWKTVDESTLSIKYLKELPKTHVTKPREFIMKGPNK